MKRTLIAVLLMTAAATAASARTRYAFDAGSFALRGAASYARGFGAAYDDHMLEFAPAVSWFFLPRLALSAELQLRMEDRNGVSYHSAGGWMQLRYYFGEEAGTVFPFIGAGAGGGAVNYSTVDSSFFGFRFDGGVCFMLNRWVSLDLSGCYRLEQVDGKAKGGVVRIFAGVGFYLF